jgi:ferric-dicitrate binding protein FerR (iron transport regulator)
VAEASEEILDEVESDIPFVVRVGNLSFRVMASVVDVQRAEMKRTSVRVVETLMEMVSQ